MLDGVFAVLGDGGIDFDGVCAALAAASYHGWLVVEAEPDPAKAPPLAYARVGFAHLRTARGTTSPWVTVRRRRGGAGSARRLP